MSVPRSESVSLRDQAYRVLLEAIVSGRLAPGAPIRDQDLADKLAVSRTPVRAALQRLATDLDLTIQVSHLPPGTSQGNKIEHRLFSVLSRAWRAAR